MAKKKTTKAAGAKKTTSAARPSAAPGDFAARVADLVTQVKAVKSGAVGLGLGKLSAGDRETSLGKFRGGEEVAISVVFDTVDALPAVFVSIADKDGGSDPNVVETAPARAALAQREALAPLLAALEDARQIVSDAVLAAGATAKEVSGPAYRIITANAGVNKKLATAAADALSFYGAAAKKAASTRKKAKKPPPAPTT